MRLLVSLVLALGVSVPVQVMPPSPLLRPVTVPLATVRSAVVKPVTASLKVKVTKDVSPTIREVSPTTMLEIERTSGGERVCKYGEIPVAAEQLKEKHHYTNHI